MLAFFVFSLQAKQPKLEQHEPGQFLSLVRDVEPDWEPCCGTSSIPAARRGVSGTCVEGPNSGPHQLPGPSTPTECLLWPMYQLESLSVEGSSLCGVDFGAKARQRMYAGVLLSTDYSGIGCAEQACEQLHRASWIVGRSQCEPVPECCMSASQRAGDLTKHCRQVLKGHSGIFQPGCVHGNILDRCPPQDLGRMQSIRLKVLKEVGEQVANGERYRPGELLQLGRDVVRQCA